MQITKTKPSIHNEYEFVAWFPKKKCHVDDTKQCATSLGLQVQSVVARVILTTRMTRG
jgi:hypothetical protein